MRENVYGHQKRLQFLIGEIERHRARRAISREVVQILDIGCGTGVMITRPLAELGYTVTGLDIDDASIRQAARLNVSPHLPNLSYVAGPLEAQASERAFDAIICSEVLEHLPEPARLVADMRQRLTDDGILLITVPNGYGPFELDSLVWRLLSRIPGLKVLGRAVRIAAKPLLLRLFAGWIDVRAREEENRPENRATLNEVPHIQHLTYRRVLRLFRQLGFCLQSSGKSSVWSGPLAGLIMQEFRGLIRLNSRLADFLPSALVSGWYFCFRKDTQAQAGQMPVTSESPLPRGGSNVAPGISAKDLAKLVHDAYTRLAERSSEASARTYRFHNVYIATKALSDWTLVSSLELSGKVVLNVGCGEPIDELHFARRDIGGWVVLDANLKVLEMAKVILAREASEQVGGRVKFVAGDATALPFPEGVFDVVLAFSTLEHIPDIAARERAFGELARVTKKGGHVVVTAPNRYSTFFFAHRRNMRLGIADYGYAYLYSPLELRRQLQKLDLEILRFGSELSALSMLPSYLPAPLRWALRPFRYLGERIGYVARKR